MVFCASVEEVGHGGREGGWQAGEPRPERGPDSYWLASFAGGQDLPSDPALASAETPPWVGVSLPECCEATGFGWRDSGASGGDEDANDGLAVEGDVRRQNRI